MPTVRTPSSTPVPDAASELPEAGAAVGSSAAVSAGVSAGVLPQAARERTMARARRRVRILFISVRTFRNVFAAGKLGPQEQKMDRFVKRSMEKRKETKVIPTTQ